MDEHLGCNIIFIRNMAVNNLLHMLFPICWVYLQRKFPGGGFLGQRVNEYVVLFDFTKFPSLDTG